MKLLQTTAEVTTQTLQEIIIEITALLQEAAHQTGTTLLHQARQEVQVVLEAAGQEAALAGVDPAEVAEEEEVN